MRAGARSRSKAGGWSEPRTTCDLYAPSPAVTRASIRGSCPRCATAPRRPSNRPRPSPCSKSSRPRAAQTPKGRPLFSIECKSTSIQRRGTETRGHGFRQSSRVPVSLCLIIPDSSPQRRGEGVERRLQFFEVCGAVEEFGEAGGHFDGATDERLDDRLELRGVRGGDDDPVR